MREDQVRGWNSVDGVLGRLNLCGDVTLVLRPEHWIGLDRFKALTEQYFPLMWKSGRVVLEERPPATEVVTLKGIQNVSWEMF